MHALLLASAVLDCGAVAGIAWLLKRNARERDTTLAAQRAALERLCEDVAQLVRDAEERTSAAFRTNSLGSRRYESAMDIGGFRTPLTGSVHPESRNQQKECGDKGKDPDSSHVPQIPVRTNERLHHARHRAYFHRAFRD